MAHHSSQPATLENTGSFSNTKIYLSPNPTKNEYQEFEIDCSQETQANSEFNKVRKMFRDAEALFEMSGKDLRLASGQLTCAERGIIKTVTEYNGFNPKLKTAGRP